MTSTLPSPGTTEPTDVRFSIRTLLFLMIGVSLGAALLGPFIRALAPEERRLLASQWGITALVAMGLLAYHARTRIRLEREAGPRILLLEPRGRWIKHHTPWVTIANGCFLILFAFFYLLRPTDSRMFSNLFRGGVAGCVLAAGIVTMWWNQYIQLRANGALYGLRLLKWSHVTAHTWELGVLKIEGLDQHHNDAQLNANISADGRQQVENLIAERVRERQQIAPELLTSSDATAAKLPPIKISPSQNITLRGFFVGLAVYVAIVITVVFRPWGDPTREFNAGFFLGIIATSIWSFYRRRTVTDAGAPLIRLTAQTDWRKVAAGILVAIVAYYIEQHLPIFNFLLDGTLGAICAVGIVNVFQIILLQRFDLCENGIVLMKYTYWPWNTVTISKWNRDTNGRLVLGRGWRRILAKVPPHERTVVDSVLHEKVTASNGAKATDPSAAPVSAES